MKARELHDAVAARMRDCPCFPGRIRHRCGHVRDDGLVCTRRRGHIGVHVACTDAGHAVASWGTGMLILESIADVATRSAS